MGDPLSSSEGRGVKHFWCQQRSMSVFRGPHALAGPTPADPKGLLRCRRAPGLGPRSSSKHDWIRVSGSGVLGFVPRDLPASRAPTATGAGCSGGPEPGLGGGQRVARAGEGAPVFAAERPCLPERGATGCAPGRVPWRGAKAKARPLSTRRAGEGRARPSERLSSHNPQAANPLSAPPALAAGAWGRNPSPQDQTNHPCFNPGPDPVIAPIPTGTPAPVRHSACSGPPPRPTPASSQGPAPTSAPWPTPAWSGPPAPTNPSLVKVPAPTPTPGQEPRLPYSEDLAPTDSSLVNVPTSGGKGPAPTRPWSDTNTVGTSNPDRHPPLFEARPASRP